MTKHFIIGDIAGQYDALLRLIDKAPKDSIIVSIGDMVDRGPQSKQVLDFFREPGRLAILGNHEHMMIDHILEGRFYDPGVWHSNGGDMTIQSFGLPPHEVFDNKELREYCFWLKSLPLYLEIDDCLISHSFPIHGQSLNELCNFGKSIWEKYEDTIIWSRWKPERRKDYRLQVAGHNSQFGLKEFHDEQGLYAICLDDSKKKVLTGYVLETAEIIQEPF